VVAPEGSTCRQWLLRMHDGTGRLPRIEHVAMEFDTQLALVRAGLGIALVPRLGRAALGADLTAVAVADPVPSREIVAVHRASMSDSPAIKALLAALSSRLPGARGWRNCRPSAWRQRPGWADVLLLDVLLEGGQPLVPAEWHSRYGGRGILAYWHGERGSVAVHSQTLRASASEVHAMVEGAIRHGTAMNVEGNYVDSHGQSEIGFGITRLLNIDLLPRIKRINKVRLYRPAAGDPGAYPRLTPALTRPIRWDIIAASYDQVIRYATAIREGTASTEAVRSRFTRSATHPAYQAMLQIGRGQRTVFAARYLRDRDLQREIEEGLNVVEAWNGANAVICYGRGGEISTNRHGGSRDADRRGLTPLFWQHVSPYGEVRLDMGARLRIGAAG
jgi:hypothetical protein